MFDYRQLPWLIKQCQLPATFIDSLIQLQTKIYVLDKYIEKNWVIDEPHLADLAQAIKEELHKLGYNELDINKLLGSFAIYLKRELAIREGGYPSEVPIEDFYLHKSCDVKLHRKVIADRSATYIFNDEDWTTFDLITEVNDDIEDLVEDTLSINGNRLLFSLNLKPKNELFNEYQRFIEHLKHLCAKIENPHIGSLARQELRQAELKLSNLFNEFENLKPGYRLAFLEAGL